MRDQETEGGEKREEKKARTAAAGIGIGMPPTDPNGESFLFPVEEIVQYPLPGCVAPSAISFSPDDLTVTYLFSPDASLYRKVFAFDLATRRQVLVFGPPDGGLDESNLSPEEKLRRERARERGLGVTRYEWRARSPASIMLPLPSGVYFQDLSGSEPELKLKSTVDLPIIDPHLSPDGSMLAYVMDDELHVFDLSSAESKQLTAGARCSGKPEDWKVGHTWLLKAGEVK